MRFILLLVLLSCSAVAMHAQSSSASQTIQLVLYPTIDLRFTNTNTTTGNTVSMGFHNAAQAAAGVISGTQELEVRSNKNFKISVQTDASSFSYTGAQAPSAAMPVNNTLYMAVASHTTGGTLASGFSNYTSLSPSTQDIIMNGLYGNDKKLVLAYKATPDMSYPAGIYSVGVIYTATQP